MACQSSVSLGLSQFADSDMDPPPFSAASLVTISWALPPLAARLPRALWALLRFSVQKEVGYDK